jgi:hypothetical protein
VYTVLYTQRREIPLLFVSIIAEPSLFSTVHVYLVSKKLKLTTWKRLLSAGKEIYIYKRVMEKRKGYKSVFVNIVGSKSGVTLHKLKP